MNDKNQGLNERLEHRKRIQRMKTGLLWFVFTWMLAIMLIEVTLIAKVISLQEQLDIITENTIRSQQVEQQEHQSPNTNQVQKYGTSVNKNEDEETNKTEGNEQNNKNKTDGKNAADPALAGQPAAKAQKTNHIQPSVADMEDGDPQDNENKEDSKSKEEVRKVYLTFDDGPSKNTEKILDILDKYKVKATFFVTGREDSESLQRYKEIADRGHTIGMHSYSHKYDEIYDSIEAFEQDLAKIQSLILDTTGQTCTLYRFPGGSSNQVSGMDMLEFIRVLKEKKITYFDWNAECGDASSHQYSAREMVDNVMRDVVKYHTSVVLLHDAEDKPNTIKALPKLIKQLKKMDAQILPIDEDTTVVQHVLAENVED